MGDVENDSGTDAHTIHSAGNRNAWANLKFREWLSGKKKIIGMLLAAAVQVYGMRNGWDPDVRNSVSMIFMGGVTVEGVIDALALFRKGTP